MRTVVMIGFGAIGRQVASLLAPEIDSGRLRLCALVRDLTRYAEHRQTGVDLLPITSPTHPQWSALLAEAEFVVECAGVPAAREFGPATVAAGTAFLITSVGVLADQDTRRRLLAGPGDFRITNGAIGGLDVLEAAAQAGMLAEVRLRTSKSAAGLVQPWMSAEESARLLSLSPADGPLTIFSGNPAEAIAKFPANVNIAVALAWATRGLADADADDDELMARALESVHVELVAEPAAARTGHLISARGAAGTFEFTIHSTPSPVNPATSGQTALSVTRSVREILAELDRHPSHRDSRRS